MVYSAVTGVYSGFNEVSRSVPNVSGYAGVQGGWCLGRPPGGDQVG